MSKIKVVELEDKTDNLCDYCDCDYTDCISRIRFGTNPSGDNIVGCNNFQGEIKDTFIEEKEYTEEELNKIYED